LTRPWPPPPPIDIQYVRGDLDPALVVAPIVAGMALCAYLMHVYTKAGLNPNP